MTRAVATIVRGVNQGLIKKRLFMLKLVTWMLFQWYLRTTHRSVPWQSTFTRSTTVDSDKRRNANERFYAMAGEWIKKEAHSIISVFTCVHSLWQSTMAGFWFLASMPRYSTLPAQLWCNSSMDQYWCILLNGAAISASAPSSSNNVIDGRRQHHPCVIIPRLDGDWTRSRTANDGRHCCVISRDKYCYQMLIVKYWYTFCSTSIGCESIAIKLITSTPWCKHSTCIDLVIAE